MAAVSTKDNGNAKDKKMNMHVIIRARPPNATEINDGSKVLVEYLSQKNLSTINKKFIFDRIFQPDANQIEVYEHVMPMIFDIFSGYNCTVIAFGESGSGKTYTMTGNKCIINNDWKKDPDTGIILKAASHIFQLLRTGSSDTPDNFVKVSYIELYNEEIYDLLCEDYTPLKIQNDINGSIIIQGLKEVTAYNSKDVCKLLQKCLANRQTIPALTNSRRSQSHTIFTITILTNGTTHSNKRTCKFGKISFVDLAGSENISRSDSKDAKLNKSLLTFGKVIYTLADKRKKYVPYRESILTRILHESLGGRHKTCFIATISPVSSETLNTLEFANQAKNITNDPRINGEIDSEKIIDGLLSTIKSLERDIEATRTSEGFYINSDNYSAIVKEIEDLRKKRHHYGGLITEKNQQIEKLEHQLKVAKEEVHKITDMSRKSREQVEKLKSDITKEKDCLKKECFLSQSYEHEANQIHQEAKGLIKTSQLLSEHTGRVRRKLEKRFHLNNLNEAITHESVDKLNDMLNKLFEEGNRINIDDNIRSMQQDIANLKEALQMPSKKIKMIFVNLDNSSSLNDSVKEKFFELLYDCMGIIKNNVCEIKSRIDEVLLKRQQFEHDHLSELPNSIKHVIGKFHETVIKMTMEITSEFKRKDLDFNNAFEHLEEQMLAKQKETEVMNQQLMQRDAKITNLIRELKEELGKQHQEKKVEIISTELMEIVKNSRKETDEIIENFIDAFEMKNSNVVTKEDFDSIPVEMEKLEENMEAEIEKLETINKMHFNQSCKSLEKNLLSQIQDLERTTQSNYNSLENRLSYIKSDDQQRKKNLENFTARMKKVLSEEFIQNIVPTRHEGDTPTGKHETGRVKIRSLTPRDILLQKFKNGFNVEQAATNGVPNVTDLSEFEITQKLTDL